MHCYLPRFQDHNLNNKKAIVRVDLNVPIQSGLIIDDMRIQAILPTLNHLIKQGTTLIILSHLGRPRGQINPDFSLRILVKPLSEYLQRDILFIEDCIGPAVQDKIDKQPQGSIILLENCRFYPQEEKNDANFALSLSQLADIYINDGFGMSHRAHASVVGITQYLPSYAGFLMQSEMQALSQGWLKAEKPLMLILGGAKISTKLQLLATFIEVAQTIVVGGGIANTLLKAKEQMVGSSLYEPEFLKQATDILKKADHYRCRLILPVGAAVSFDLHYPTTLKAIEHIEAQDKIFDIGPQTINIIRKALAQHKTVIWNGPLGIFEHPPYNQSTKLLAQEIADLSKAHKLYSLAGGGETVAAIRQCNMAAHFSYLSTGGGAFLEFLEGNILPGIEALQRNCPKIG